MMKWLDTCGFNVVIISAFCLINTIQFIIPPLFNSILQ